MGDYNLVFALRRKKGWHCKNTQKITGSFNKFYEDLDSVDFWRVQNPESQCFTCRQRKPEIHCRLDFFLINKSILCSTINTGIVLGTKRIIQ